MNNKKTLILSIVGVLVLVIVVVGISYAMYTFTGTGTKENLITTGTISVSYPTETSNVNLTAAYPSTDAAGIAATDKCVGYTGDVEPTSKTACTTANGTWQATTLQFGVSATLSGTTRIDYEIAIDPVAGNTLDEQYVKFNLQKDTGTGYTYILGTATTGVLANDYAAVAGSLPNTTIARGKIDAGSFSATTTHNYILKAWVSDAYNLMATTSETGNCSGGTSSGNETSEAACSAVNGNWSPSHNSTVTSQTYAFKIKAYATQYTGA